MKRLKRFRLSRKKDIEKNSSSKDASSSSKITFLKHGINLKKAGAQKHGKANLKRKSDELNSELSVETDSSTKPTDTDTTETDIDDEHDEHADSEKHAEIEDVSQTGGRILENLAVKQNIFVTVRLIESRDFRDSGSLRARVRLDGRSKATRVTTELHPEWKQNLNFTVEATLEEAATKTLTIQVCGVRRVLGDKLLGEFSCPLAIIIHQEKSAMLNKWIAVAPPPKDGKHADRDETVGFVKVSIAVYGSSDSPPLLHDDDSSEDIFQGAHFAEYSLRVRLHRVLQVCEAVLRATTTKKKKASKHDTLFCVKVGIGLYHEVTTLEELEKTSIDFQQDILLPFMWPTIVNKLILQLLMIRGKKSCVLAEAELCLKDIYAPGIDGYLPQFGPAFVNFYGPEDVAKLKCDVRRRNVVALSENDKSKFYGRMLVSVECFDALSETSERVTLNNAAIEYSKQFERLHHYSLFASMTACNQINARYSAMNVAFLISMGDYGSPDKMFPLPRSSTHPAMPDYDECTQFVMGWGNHQALLEFGALWENVHHRAERSNAIIAVAAILDTMLTEIAALGGQRAHQGADLILEAVETAAGMLDAIKHHHSPTNLRTKHDFFLQELRHNMIVDLRHELFDILFESLPIEKAVDEGVRALCRTTLALRKLARDAECSLPDILIKMIANEKLVAYTKIPAHEVLYSVVGEALSGHQCGKVVPIQLTWLDEAVKKKCFSDEVPAVLHVKLWLGRHANVAAYLESLKPAEPKCYWEVYHYQKRSTPLSEWGTLAYYDYSGKNIDAKKGFQAPDGWTFTGFWAVRNTHDRWITADKGKIVFDDKLFELQQRTVEGWKFIAFTDGWGGRIQERAMNTPPKGWKYDGPWSRDLHAPGDKDGWIYSVSGAFGPEAGAERAERITHNFRRRLLTRTRRTREDQKDEGRDLHAVQALLGAEDAWEYSSGSSGIFHDKCMSGDLIRRRRFVIPVAKTANAVKNFNIVRRYEVHDAVSQWQLRAYFFWAKDLLPLTSDFSSRAFIRVSYLHASKQTLVVERTANPVFNETLIFDKLLIPGSHATISDCPPSVLVEVKGERHDDSEAFLGRFSARPTVVCAPSDSRAKMRWHTLRFGSSRTRGALLCAFELFLRDADHKVELPLMPAKKRSGAIEVPAELRPKFSRYSIQMLCWGVRNLQRHNLLTVRRPFISMVFGDSDAKTRPLTDVRENPNFAEPLLTFNDVLLPDSLELSPPLILSLHDERAFRRQPLVGVCLVSDYRKFLKRASIKKDTKSSEVRDWKEFDALIEHEESVETTSLTAEEEDLEDLGEYRIDWWSKYYTSIGMPQRAPGFEKTGIETLRCFDWPLENTVEYNGFKDFLDSFNFKRSAKGHFDDHEEKEITGELKGRLLIRKHEGDGPPELAPPSGIEFPGVTPCKVRLYVVSASGLVIKNTNRACDSYVVARIGKHQISRKSAYRPDDVDPEFGEVFEFDVDLPLEKDLHIRVMNRRRIIRDEEIGTTTIDLENRLLTKFRATVGLSRQFTVKGELVWRDQMSPLLILRRYCQRMGLAPPSILHRQLADNIEDRGLEILGVSFWLSDLDRDSQVRLRVGRKLQRLALFILHKMGLVPEHVETRPLYGLENSKQEVGKLRCWVDIMPLCLGPLPPPVDISIREPEPYQLRLAIFNVFNAFVCKRNFQQPCGDLYVKAFLNGDRKGERTDVHYRVLDGYASFNYRLILDFEWNPWEKKIYAKEKSRFMRKSRTELTDSLLILQLWDNNKFSKDTLLGELLLDLQGFQEGMLDPEEIEAVYYSHMQYKGLCRRCMTHSWTHRPTLCCNPRRKSAIQRRQVIPLPRAPRYTPPQSTDPYFHPFECEPLRGFFPVLRKGRELPPEQRLDALIRKKKNDDDVDVHADAEYITGVVEMEMHLVSREDPLADKVGRKRKSPNHSPRLDNPDRSAWDSHWLLSRVRPCLRHFWHRYGIVVIVWMIVAIFFLLFFASILYNLPDIMQDTVSAGAETLVDE